MFLTLAPISLGLSAYGLQQQRLWLLLVAPLLMVPFALLFPAAWGKPLPHPDPSCTDPDADLEEPIHFRLRAM